MSQEFYPLLREPKFFKFGFNFTEMLEKLKEKKLRGIIDTYRSTYFQTFQRITVYPKHRNHVRKFGWCLQTIIETIFEHSARDCRLSSKPYSSILLVIADYHRNHIRTFGWCACIIINIFENSAGVRASSKPSSKMQLVFVQAIMRPLALKTSKLRVLLTIFTIWGLSSLISLPPIIFSQEFPISRSIRNDLFRIRPRLFKDPDPDPTHHFLTGVPHQQVTKTVL